MGPVFLSEAASQRALPFFRKVLPRAGYYNIPVSPGLRLDAVLPLRKVKTAHRITYLLDLSLGEELLFKGLSPTRRNIVRKATRELPELDVASADYKGFAKLHQANFQSKGLRYFYPAGFLEKVVSVASTQGFGALFTAPGAGVFIVYDHATAYLLLTAMDRKLAHSGAVSLLLWRALCYSVQLGLSRFDFEGSSDPGIALFFRSFGGQEVPYQVFEASPSLLWRLKKRLFR
jgi:CelD/BcsL family acetyltransferase involved in cellulose biosynthesis